MKTVKIVLILIFLSVAGFIIYRSFIKSDKIAYSTINLKERNIDESIFIPGNVFPAKEIEIKSQLSGILDSIFVKIGESIRSGAAIASIKLVPNSSDIERLESNVNLAQIQFDANSKNYQMEKKLYDTQVIAKSEMDITIRDYQIAEENLTSAKNQLDLLKKGRVTSKNISNIVSASTSGTVIDIPQETGASVIERNNYNPGTTIAIVAETNLFKFNTLVAEQYLKYISIDDTITLTFNAYQNFMTKAVVTKISSKGYSENGIMKYSLEAEFAITKDMPVLRSGYSATAEIILNRKRNVLSVEEKYITYKNDSVYLYVMGGLDKEPKKRNIKTGVSDGTYTEILEGVMNNDKIVINYDNQ